MKKINKKGFTLIELLAVIVILAILIAVAVPAITRYLASARANTFKDNALSVIEAVRKDKIINGGETTTYTYKYINDNRLLEKKLNKSPYGEDYKESSCVKVTTDESTGTDTYLICLTDGKYGIKGTEDEIISGKRVVGEEEVKVTSMASCTCD